MKKIILRASALLLALLMAALCFASCGNKSGKTLMTLQKDGKTVTLSVNTYELMLSRMKGTLCYYGYTANGVTADKDGFWSYIDKFNGVDTQTIDEYYRSSILDNCRTYLAALYMFEEKGLSLSAAEEEAVQEMLDELLQTDGNGSKTKLNSVLAAYGVNYDILKEAYLMEAKIAALQKALYGENASAVGENLKTEFMNEHYVHFHQIFLPSYTYVCEKDKNGDIIYYHTDGDHKDHIYYDTYNGVKDERNGEAVKDKNGDVIYYVPSSDYTKIAYDSVNGQPSYVPNTDSSGYQTESLSAEKLEELKARANELVTDLQGCTAEEFEQAIVKESDDVSDASTYNDGYYLQKGIEYSASGSSYVYLEEIVEKLEGMQVGDIALVSSAFGYHIIMKYEHTEKAYEKEENETWFENFNTALIEKLFLEACQSYYPYITVDDKVLAEAPTMKDVSVNYNY